MTALAFQGGWIMLAIVALSFAAWMLMAWKWFLLRDEYAMSLQWADDVLALARRDEMAQARERCARETGCVAMVLRMALEIRNPDHTHFEKYLWPVLDSESVRLNRGLSMVQALGAVAPLLGLLGTVQGMILTFGSVTLQGVPEMEGVAAGVSQALITTQAGLVAGLAIMLVHGYLEAMAQKRIEIAELYAKKLETAVLHD